MIGMFKKILFHQVVSRYLCCKYKYYSVRTNTKMQKILIWVSKTNFSKEFDNSTLTKDFSSKKFERFQYTSLKNPLHYCLFKVCCTL
jgi:hypothetical protein